MSSLPDSLATAPDALDYQGQLIFAQALSGAGHRTRPQMQFEVSMGMGDLA